MGSHFVTLGPHVGRLPAWRPSSCHRRARFSLRQNARTLRACSVSHPGVIAALTGQLSPVIGFNREDRALVKAPSLADDTPVVLKPGVDYHAPSVNSYVAAVDAPDGVANQVWLAWRLLSRWHPLVSRPQPLRFHKTPICAIIIWGDKCLQ